jgi:hypothetical protein
MEKGRIAGSHEVESSLRLAITSSAQKMARFALSFGLKKDPGLGQELLRGAQRFSLGDDLGTCGVLIWRTYIRMGEKLVRIRQPDRNDDAAGRFDPAKEPDPRLWSEFCGRGVPFPNPRCVRSSW